MSAPTRFGRYRVERRIGSGSFATVWLAHDEVLDAPVAVKVLADNWAHRMDIRERFEEEARILRRADSDRVVRVHDIGELEDGRPYFVMTYADGGTLADRLAAGPLPVPVALRFGADVARGLAVLHEVGVIHRDVNPANVLLCSGRGGVGDRVLIADLGLAKAAARGSGFTLTVGTPGYMAPEQASGAGVTKRTDVYAVGALLWHLLTGAPPDPDGALPAVSLPPAVEAVLRQALARRPEDRFPSAGALADTLDAAAIESARAPRARPEPRGVRAPAAADPRPGPAGRPEPPRVDDTLPVQLRRPGREPRPASVARSEPAPAQDTLTMRMRSSRPRRRRLVAVLAVVVLLAGGGAVALVLRDRAEVDVGSADGTLRVRVPATWARQVQRSDWDLTPYGVTGRAGTALAVAGNLARWRDPASGDPGVFVGRADGVAPARLLAGSPAAGCPGSAPRPVQRDGLSGTVTRRACAGSPAAYVEAVLQPPGAQFTVYLQVKEPAADARADGVVASLAVSWSR